MGTQKIWAFGKADTIYSDLSGSAKYLIAFQPYNYFQDITSQVTQYSFRFFNDDGNESNATPKANLNVSPMLGPSDIIRLRILLNATGDFDSKRFKLECRYKPPGGSFGPWEIIL